MDTTSPAPSVKLSTKAIEIVGRNWLTARLLSRGLAVATPEIDDGIDLLVFQSVPDVGVRAIPLQLKCAAARSFSLDKKYAGRGVVMTYVWNVLGPAPEVYFLSYDEALKTLGASAGTASWLDRGYYAINQIGPTVQTKLDPYRDRWDWLEARLTAAPTTNVAPQP